MNPKNYNSFFIFTKGKIYYMEFREFFNDINKNSSLFNKNFNTNNSLKTGFPEPILDSDISITTACLTNKNLLVGFEDGKIHVYSYANILNFNRTTPLKANLIFSNHKGSITNIICANRPISQYGLNFNNKIEEVIVRAFKKPSIPYSDSIPVKLSLNVDNYFEKLVNEILDDNVYNHFGANEEENYIGNNLSSNLINNKNDKNSLENVDFIKGSKSINSNLNFEDPKFLKKKLAEVSEIINKY